SLRSQGKRAEYMRMRLAHAADMPRAKDNQRRAGYGRPVHGQPEDRTKPKSSQSDGLLPLPERQAKLGPHRRQGVLSGMPGAIGARPGRSAYRAHGEKALRRLRAPGQRLLPHVSAAIEFTGGNGSMPGAFTGLAR